MPVTTFHSLASRFCLLLVPAALAAGCKKEETVEPGLPDATQSGLNRAGCRVDGKNWVAYNAGLFSGPATSASWLKQNLSGRFALSILLSKNDDYNEVHSQTSISLYVPDIRSAGTFELNQSAAPSQANSNPAYGSFIFGKPAPDEVYLTSPQSTGRITVTRLDTVAHVVAGTFEFTAERRNSSPVRVTEGRFDLTYQ